MKKKCCKCKETKNCSFFDRNRSQKDGLQTMCKKCRQEYRIRNQKMLASKQRVYAKENRDKIISYRKSEHGRRMKNERAKVYVVRNRKKVRARSMIAKRVYRGKIKKPNKCSKCKKTFEKRYIHGHHHDYDKPLDVKWLCHWCHMRLHHKY